MCGFKSRPHSQYYIPVLNVRQEEPSVVVAGVAMTTLFFISYLHVKRDMKRAESG